MFDDILNQASMPYELPREDKVHPELLDRFSQMAQEFFDLTGEPLKVTDSFRTVEEQSDLYKRKPSLASPPGKSKHEIGMALDIDNSQVSKLEELGLLDTHGFIRPALHKGETWHIELDPTPGNKTMFADVLKRAEKVSAKVPEVAPTGLFEDILGSVKTEPEVMETVPTSMDTLPDITPYNISEALTGEFKTPSITREDAAIAERILGKGFHAATWPLTRLKEWIIEPAYEKLGPLVGAPMEKGFVFQKTPLESMVKPGETGQVGGETIPGEIEALTPTPREAVTSLADMYALSKLGKIPEIIKASEAGTLTRFKEMRKPELLWDNPELGNVVFQKVYKTKLESTLGPAGTEVVGPTLRDAHAQMSMQLASGRIAEPWQLGGKWKRGFGTSLKTNERILSELDDIAPGMKQEFWTNIKASENAAYRQVKIEEGKLKELADAAGGHEVGDKLGIIAIAERPRGLAALRNTGITDIPSPTIIERQTINAIKNKFQGLLERINEGRAAAGLQPVPTDINYVTFMRNVVKEEINPVLATNAEIKRATMVPFQFEKKVVGGKQEVATNLFDIYKNYHIQAEKHLNLSPHVAKINSFVLDGMVLADGTKVAPLAQTNPVIADALLQYGKSISGRYGQAFTESWGSIERGLSALSNNVVISMIAAYPRSVANQVGAITGAAAIVRPDRLIMGLKKIGDPNAWQFAMTHSRVLGQRRMDVVFEDIFGGTGKIWSELKHKGMLPLEVTDFTTAVGIWHSAVLQAESMGLKGRKAFDWADEVVIKTQGSASTIDRSNFQRTMVGKALSGLQTFTIADANLWMREIFGVGNLNKTFGQKTANLGGVLATGLAMNLFYRNVMGMPPPNPEPIRTYKQTKETGASEVGAALAVGKEIASKYMPLVGSMAMGKTPFGPLGGLIADVSQGYKGIPEVVMSLRGIPGTNVLSRLYRSEPGMELRDKLEAMTTLPLAQRTPLKLPPMTVKEALLGRLEIPPLSGPGKWELWFKEGLRR